MISKKDIHVFRERQRVLLQADEFICLRPHPSLAEYISNYNITFPTKNLMSDSFTIMPCGCATLSIENNGQKLFVCLEGSSTRPYIVESRTNQLEMLVTIEFKPAGLYAFTGISQSELTDEAVPFEVVDSELCKLISDTVEKTESVYELATSMDMLFLENMYTTCHPELLSVLQSINGCTGNITVKKLADDIHYSERQLNRIFKQHMGVSAKAFSKLIRINNTFDLLKKPADSLTLISDRMGFHDLSHFVRDFKSVCGITPQEYRKNMSGFYINTKKF